MSTMSIAEQPRQDYLHYTLCAPLARPRPCARPDATPLQVDGEIPKELTGTYFRNGPGLQVRRVAVRTSTILWQSPMQSLQRVNGTDSYAHVQRIQQGHFSAVAGPQGAPLLALRRQPRPCCALQVSSGRYQRHTFDGDGQVLSFAFQGGTCHFRNRFVQTQSFLEEQVGRGCAITIGGCYGAWRAGRLC